MGYASKVHMWDGKSKETSCSREKTGKKVTRNWDEVTCRRCRGRSPNGNSIYRLKDELMYVNVMEVSNSLYLVQRYDQGELNEIEARDTLESAKALADSWFNNGDIPYTGRIHEARTRGEHKDGILVSIVATIVVPKRRSEEFYEKIGLAAQIIDGKVTLE